MPSWSILASHVSTPTVRPGRVRPGARFVIRIPECRRQWCNANRDDSCHSWRIGVSTRCANCYTQCYYVRVRVLPAPRLPGRGHSRWLRTTRRVACPRQVTRRALSLPAGTARLPAIDGSSALTVPPAAHVPPAATCSRWRCSPGPLLCRCSPRPVLARPWCLRRPPCPRRLTGPRRRRPRQRSRRPHHPCHPLCRLPPLRAIRPPRPLPMRVEHRPSVPATGFLHLYRCRSGLFINGRLISVSVLHICDIARGKVIFQIAPRSWMWL